MHWLLNNKCISVIYYVKQPLSDRRALCQPACVTPLPLGTLVHAQQNSFLTRQGYGLIGFIRIPLPVPIRPTLPVIVGAASAESSDGLFRRKLDVPRPELARDVLVEQHVVVLVELPQGLLKAVLKLAPGLRRLAEGRGSHQGLKVDYKGLG